MLFTRALGRYDGDCYEIHVSQPPINVPSLTGSATLTTAPTRILPWTVLNALSPTFVLWVANDGPNSVDFQFLTSPDGATPDIDSIESVTLTPGLSKKMQRDGEVHLYWSLVAHDAIGGSRVRFGVTIARNTVI